MYKKKSATKLKKPSRNLNKVKRVASAKMEGAIKTAKKLEKTWKSKLDEQKKVFAKKIAQLESSAYRKALSEAVKEYAHKQVARAKALAAAEEKFERSYKSTLSKKAGKTTTAKSTPKVKAKKTGAKRRGRPAKASATKAVKAKATKAKAAPTTKGKTKAGQSRGRPRKPVQPMMETNFPVTTI